MIQFIETNVLQNIPNFFSNYFYLIIKILHQMNFRPQIDPMFTYLDDSNHVLPSFWRFLVRAFVDPSMFTHKIHEWLTFYLNLLHILD